MKFHKIVIKDPDTKDIEYIVPKRQYKALDAEAAVRIFKTAHSWNSNWIVEAREL